MDIDELMRAVAIVLGLTVVAVGLARQLALGSTLALLVVGIALGPHSPRPLLGPEHIEELQAVGEVGVVLLLFLMGIDTRPSRLWAMRGMIVGLGTLQYVVTALAIAGVLLVHGVGTGEPVLIIGLILAMSSAAVALGALDEHGDAASPEGRATLAVQILQSFVVIGLLTLIPLLGATSRSVHSPGFRHTAEVLGAIVTVQVLARWVLPRVLSLTARTLGAGALTLVIIAAVFGAAATLDSLGVSMALGAFMVGVNLSSSIYVDQLKAAVDPARRLLLGVFFITVGMALDWQEVLAAGPGPLLLIGVLLAVKFGVAASLGLLFRQGRDAALLMGALLMPFDEVGYVIFASARATGLLGPRLYALGLTFISVSFIVSPMVINLVYLLTRRMQRAATSVEPIGPGAAPVVVAGYGPGGRGVCLVLAAAGVPFIAFSKDVERVQLGIGSGHDVRYGDVADPSLLATLELDRARAVIVAVPEFVRCRHIVDGLRRFHARVPVLVAVQTLGEREQMRQLGVEEVVVLSLEGTLRLSRLALRALGVSDVTADGIVAAMEADDYLAMRSSDEALSVLDHPSAR